MIMKMSWKSGILAGLLAALALEQFACQPTPGEAYETRKLRENEEDIIAYLQRNNLQGQANRLASGVYYIITQASPSGSLPAVGDEILYHVVTRRLDGVIVDSSAAAANMPRRVIFGAPRAQQDTITARLYEGLTLLREGERAILLAPFDRSDNKQGTLLLPAYTPVRYDIRVLRIRSEDVQINEYLTAQRLTNVERTTSGLRFRLTQARPDSAQVKAGQTVFMKYTGLLLNGTQFDINQTGNYNFKVGEGQTVKGFEEAVQKLRVGEKATIILPSTIGYGAQGRNSIPPYAPLRFDVEIISSK